MFVPRGLLSFCGIFVAVDFSSLVYSISIDKRTQTVIKNNNTDHYRRYPKHIAQNERILYDTIRDVEMSQFKDVS